MSKLNAKDLMARYLSHRKALLVDLALRIEATKAELKDLKLAKPSVDDNKGMALLKWTFRRSQLDRSITHQLENIKEKRGMTIRQWAAKPLDDRLPRLFANVVREAKVLAVAREEGIDAAVLWKLANGGAV